MSDSLKRGRLPSKQVFSAQQLWVSVLRFLFMNGRMNPVSQQSSVSWQNVMQSDRKPFIWTLNQNKSSPKLQLLLISINHFGAAVTREVERWSADRSVSASKCPLARYRSPDFSRRHSIGLWVNGDHSWWAGGTLNGRLCLWMNVSWSTSRSREAWKAPFTIFSRSLKFAQQHFKTVNQHSNLPAGAGGAILPSIKAKLRVRGE